MMTKCWLIRPNHMYNNTNYHKHHNPTAHMHSQSFMCLPMSWFLSCLAWCFHVAMNDVLPGPYPLFLSLFTCCGCLLRCVLLGFFSNLCWFNTLLVTVNSVLQHYRSGHWSCAMAPSLSLHHLAQGKCEAYAISSSTHVVASEQSRVIPYYCRMWCSCPSVRPSVVVPFPLLECRCAACQQLIQHSWISNNHCQNNALHLFQKVTIECRVLTSKVMDGCNG